MNTERLPISSPEPSVDAEVGNEDPQLANITYIKDYIPQKERSLLPKKSYPSSPFDALSTVVFEGNSTGEQVLLQNPEGQVVTTDVLSSNLYLIKQSEDGTIRAFFDQYCAGYTGDDGYGVLHPHKVQKKVLHPLPDRKAYEETQMRELGWTGNETRRILEVRYDASTGEVSRNYKKRKDFRYAFEDVRRLKEVREQLKTAYANHSVPRLDTHENEEVMPENAAAD